MTYSTFDASEGLTSTSYLTGAGALAEVVDIAHANWLRDGLEYTGTPESLGTWRYHESDLHEGFWAVRNPAGQIIGYANTQTLAEAIADAMTDYPGELQV